MPLKEALQRTIGQGMGTVVSCIPGSLAFVATEDERFIPERHDPIEKPEYLRFAVERRDENSHVEQGISMRLWMHCKSNTSKALTHNN